jgi:hypothetical protein
MPISGWCGWVGGDDVVAAVEVVTTNALAATAESNND